MLSPAPDSLLEFPYPTPPGDGEVVEVAPGLLWARLSLPFRLDHVNIYLIEDEGGWAALDAGIGIESSKASWEKLLAGPLAGQRLTRLIVTHFHPDHIGLAGWLAERCSIPIMTSQTSWLGCLNISLSPGALDAKPYRDFYARHGLDPAVTELVATQGHSYLKQVTPLPSTFRRLLARDVLRIGRREFTVMTGDGHAPEQVMLHCAEEGLFLAADQVLAKITPNVSVWPVDPEGDPLGYYLRSLGDIRAGVDQGVLVLPGHQLPFRGLHARIGELVEHHAERCALIAQACADAPRSVAELVPVLFPRKLDPHQLGFAFSEVHAHVNYMVGRGEIAWVRPAGAVMRVVGATA